MRSGFFGLLFASALAPACAPATLDYEALTSAADARQRSAGAPAGPAGKDVAPLLAKPLSAESSARIAVLNNRGLRAAVETLAAAQARLAATRRLPNPTAEGELKFGADETEIELGAMIDLTDLMFVLPRSGAARAEVDAARLEAIGAILDVSYEARQAFYEYQGALQLLELLRTATEAFAASAEVARQLRAAGNITELDAALQESAFQEARLSFQRAEAQLARTRERMNAVLGLWGRDGDWQAPARLPEPPAREIELSKLESDAIARSLDLELTRRRFTASAKRANVASVSGWLPEIKAGVAAERDEHWGVGPALELELPLFYQGQGEVALARSEMRRQQSLFFHTAVRLRARSRDIAARLAAAREAVAYYRDVLLPLKQKILDETQLQYNAMLVGVAQLLRVKRDQVETARAYVEQLQNYWTLRTEAERLLAGRLGGELPGVELAGSAAARPAPGAGVDAH